MFTWPPFISTGVKADYARIRQGWLPTPERLCILQRSESVLMNLMGNAVKFTSNGYVKVVCSVDRTMQANPGEVYLKFEIQYEDRRLVLH